jgi:hypothetical protein
VREERKLEDEREKGGRERKYFENEKRICRFKTIKAVEIQCAHAYRTIVHPRTLSL